MTKAAIVLLLCTASISGAYGKSCTPKEAEAAEEMVGRLDSWGKVSAMHKQFWQCDDGSIAEGSSEAIARLLVDHWATLPSLAALIKHNPSLRKFVLRHLDGTVDPSDLEKIRNLASSSCKQGMMRLCADLKKSVRRASK